MTSTSWWRHATLVAILGLGLTAVAWKSTARSEAAQPGAPDRSAWRWYKGNTHTHTLESDGDSTPEDVTRWYREHGYQFLVLSDHNVLTRIDALSTRVRGADEQFLLVPGEEVTDVVRRQAAAHQRPEPASSSVDAARRGDGTSTRCSATSTRFATPTACRTSTTRTSAGPITAGGPAAARALPAASRSSTAIRR